MATALEPYFEVTIEEEMNKPYVKQFMSQINEKLMEAIQCLSRQAGGIEANRCPARLMEMVKLTMDNFDDITPHLVKNHECLLEDSRESRGIQPSFPVSDFIDLTHEKATLRAKRTIQMLQREKKALKQEIKTLQQEIENESARNEQLQERIETLEQKINNLQQENETLQPKIKTLQEEIVNDQFDHWQERCTLWQENFNLRIQILGKRDLLNSDIKCKICFTKELQVEYQPCHHIFSCQDCVDGLNNICPVCRTGITNINRVYLS